MKKNVLIVAALATTMFSSAQTDSSSGVESEEVLKNKKGFAILPQGGDIALGFNATPLINLALNAVNIQTNTGQTGSNVLQYTESSNMQIVGKYFLTNETAVRVRFGYNTLKGSLSNKVQDAIAMAAAVNGTQDDIDAASLLKVDDELHYKKSNVNITVGYEKRRGYGRLQGFYGVDGGINWTKSDAKVTYGNEFSDQHNVEFTDFTSNVNNSIVTLNPSSSVDRSRFLNKEFKGGFGFGARAFIGVEYFFAPKMSIAAEYGWGYTYTNSSSETTKQETYHNGQNGPTVIIENIDDAESNSTHNIGVDNNNSGSNGFSNTFNNTTLSGSSASITLLLHF